ncbi:hypothetical protein Q9R08_04890 [Microbacterium sp. QXD-8]|uniref:Uncharacterized protein n=1 Tax=Microbacterium psychrotolerans TaxID=3068321 RepID=A0ABU0YZW5_9MICO|nr:hypothetical protein [Microbacterium sp. QXD-8]MDQ7877308.1 hypothetical protein [Microbacterium sp. QXD-8]
MSGDPFDPVEVGPDAPSLGPGEEWVQPAGRPGHRIVVQTIPEDAPPAVREGLARRRIQAIEGVCPCDGLLIWRDEHPDLSVWSGVGRGSDVVQVHRDACPAHDLNLVPALERWRQGRSQ